MRAFIILAITLWSATAAAQPMRGRVECNTDRRDLRELPTAAAEAEAAVRQGIAAIQATAERHARTSPRLAACALLAGKDAVGRESNGDPQHPSYALATVALEYLRAQGSTPVWVSAKARQQPRPAQTRYQRYKAAQAAKQAARQARQPAARSVAPPSRIVWPQGQPLCPVRAELQPLMGAVLSKLMGDSPVSEFEPIARKHTPRDVVCALRFAASKTTLRAAAEKLLAEIGSDPVLP